MLKYKLEPKKFTIKQQYKYKIKKKLSLKMYSYTILCYTKKLDNCITKCESIFISILNLYCIPCYNVQKDEIKTVTCGI